MKDEIRKPDSTLRSTLKSIFRKHEYYGMWGNKHGYRIEDVMSDIVSLISQNDIPKERVLTRDEIADIIFRDDTMLDDPSYNIPRRTIEACKKLADALIKAGSIKVGVEEIKDTIVNNKITPELVEKHFPKGQCNERGNAIVLHAEMLIELARVTADYLKEKE